MVLKQSKKDPLNADADAPPLPLSVILPVPRLSKPFIVGVCTSKVPVPSSSYFAPLVVPYTMALRTLMLRIMTSRPMVTMMRRANENHPRTMALVPTPLRTAPFPKSWAITDAATEAVCCHSTDTSTKMDAMKMMARAICETNRDGKGLTSRSDPSESSSSCHPGKVARSRRQTKAKMMAMMLLTVSIVQPCGACDSHQVGKHNHVLELGGQPNQVQRILVD